MVGGEKVVLLCPALFQDQCFPARDERLLAVPGESGPMACPVRTWALRRSCGSFSCEPVRRPRLPRPWLHLACPWSREKTRSTTFEDPRILLRTVSEGAVRMESAERTVFLPGKSTERSGFEENFSMVCRQSFPVSQLGQYRRTIVRFAGEQHVQLTLFRLSPPVR